MTKILFALTGLLFAAGAHADYLRDIQVTMQKANSGTEALMLWNVYRMTDSGGGSVVCGFVKGFDNTAHFVPFMYKGGQQVYQVSPCSRTTSPV
ncbi:TPA: hypothetical protein G8W59_002861 [Salmonella enterica]|uniref:Uncharacterized protein n=1 Tax=Salmonella enterica TaxID=28901 RepID=A0A759QMS8_SALER|nr:hypothetical protein [Salmonella enterica]